jgi:dTDP-4-amino-4,6-dideoxygalactose transaminase
MKLKVPLLRPYFGSEELEEIRKVLESGWVSRDQIIPV